MKTPDYIPRNLYFNRISPFLGKQIIKVLTGQRRVGKSYIIYHLIDSIKDSNAGANIIYINCELEQFFNIRTHIDLLKYVRQKIIIGRENYLFIDEIQEISSFEIALRSLFAENLCDITCTGSNAGMLSGELATYLSGRYIKFNIHSLGYSEFLDFHKGSPSYETIIQYLKYGGMPYLVQIGLNDEMPFEYLRSVYSTILLKDVVARENIRNVAFLENLVQYLAGNIGNLFSANNISKYLKSQRVSMSPQLVINYLKALCNSYFIHKVVRVNIVGLKVFEIGEKYYFEDLGLRNALWAYSQRTDIHQLLENAVYLYLRHSNYNVFIGQLGNNEVDFVAEKEGSRIYVQVCLQMTSDSTRGREFGNLLKIQDNYPKFVVSLNEPILRDNYKGIKHLNIHDFLMLQL